MYNTQENDLDSSDKNPPSTGGWNTLDFIFNVT
jgi:hypothetical protein